MDIIRRGEWRRMPTVGVYAIMEDGSRRPILEEGDLNILPGPGGGLYVIDLAWVEYKYYRSPTKFIARLLEKEEDTAGVREVEVQIVDEEGNVVHAERYPLPLPETEGKEREEVEDWVKAFLSSGPLPTVDAFLLLSSGRKVQLIDTTDPIEPEEYAALPAPGGGWYVIDTAGDGAEAALYGSLAEFADSLIVWNLFKSQKKKREVERGLERAASIVVRVEGKDAVYYEEEIPLSRRTSRLRLLSGESPVSLFRIRV